MPYIKIRLEFAPTKGGRERIHRCWLLILMLRAFFTVDKKRALSQFGFLRLMDQFQRIGDRPWIFHEVRQIVTNPAHQRTNIVVRNDNGVFFKMELQIW